MIDKRYDGHYSICSKLRKLYQDTDDKEIREELAICVTMAKKMHERLMYYNKEAKK